MCTPGTPGCINGRQCTLCNTGYYCKLGKCEKVSGNHLGQGGGCGACLLMRGMPWCCLALMCL